MMKKIIPVCILLISCCMAKAQNNLQFNRVVLIEADSISNCGGGCPDTILLRHFTVPPNKVLKIESINFILGNYLLFLNKTPFSKTANSISNSYPIWLPSGDYFIYFATYIPNASATGQYAYTLSALEFNVVQ
jgi:hypothetical protein